MTDERSERIKALEEALSYLFSENMTAEEKQKCLSDAHWQAWDTGYADAMANRLMGGVEDAQTRLWEKNCRNKYKIDALYDLLTEQEESGDGQC